MGTLATRLKIAWLYLAARYVQTWGGRQTIEQAVRRVLRLRRVRGMRRGTIRSSQPVTDSISRETVTVRSVDAEPAGRKVPAAEITAPRIVEDVTFVFEHEALPQRPRSRLSWASLSRSRSPSPRSSMSVSVERVETEDLCMDSSVRNA